MKITKRRSKRAEASTNIVIRNGDVTFKKNKTWLIEPEMLSDTDWERIERTSPLPPDARLRISVALADYRNRVAAERGSLFTKRRVQRMRNAIQKLQSEAKVLLDDPVFFSIGLPAWSSRTGPVPADLTERLKIIREFDQVLADAQDRMQLRRGRKSSQHLASLIQQLVWIAADATGSSVKRSTKAGSLRPTSRYILACAKIADSKLSESAINNALTKCIAEYYRTLGTDGFDTAIGKYIDQV